MRKTINEWVEDCFMNSHDHGFWDDAPTMEERVKTIPLKIALIHSEASEMLEEYRETDDYGRLLAPKSLQMPDGNLKPVGFPSELADVVIRCFDLAGALGIDLESEIANKHAYNKTRPHKHGRTC